MDCQTQIGTPGLQNNSLNGTKWILDKTPSAAPSSGPVKKNCEVLVDFLNERKTLSHSPSPSFLPSSLAPVVPPTPVSCRATPPPPRRRKEQ
jgi:hypothetical protein